MMEQPICTVDVVLMTLHEQRLELAVHRREHGPFEQQFALPGGYIQPGCDADVQQAAMRVILEKTGIAAPYLEQLATFSGATRDPRGWSLSIAHYALVPYELIAPSLSPDVKLIAADAPGALPFDHGRIVAAARERLRNKSQYSSLPCYLAGDSFTLPHLQRIYELLIGEPMNKVSFRRKMDEMDFLEPVAGRFSAGAHRPAQLYRLKDALKSHLTLLQRGL